MDADVAELIETLRSPEVRAYRKQEAVRKLLELRPPGAAAAIAPLIHSDDRYLKREATKALTILPYPEAGPDLIAALADSDYVTREHAARALALSGDHRAIPKLAELEGDLFSTVRNAAADAIATIRERQPATTAESAISAPEESPATTIPATEPANPTIPQEAPATEVAVEPQPQPPPVPVPEPEPTAVPATEPVPTSSIFGEAATAIADLRARLAELRAERPQLHQRSEELARTLRLERADKDDDLAAAKATAESAKKHADEVAVLRAKTFAEHAELTKKREQFLHRAISNMLFRDDDEEALLAELEKKAAELGKTLEEARAAHAAAEQAYRALLDPIVALATEATRAAESVAENSQAIADTAAALHEQVIAAFPREHEPSRARWLEQVADAAVGQLTLREFDLARERLAVLDEAIAAAGEAIATARDCAAETVDQLAAAASAGFRVEEVRRETSVSLSGRVSFRGGASGTASGSGSGTASYVLDQPAWEPTTEFGEAIAVHAKQWQAVGGSVNEHHRLLLERAACRRSLAEFADFVLGQLDRV